MRPGTVFSLTIHTSSIPGFSLTGTAAAFAALTVGKPVTCKRQYVLPLTSALWISTAISMDRALAADCSIFPLFREDMRFIAHGRFLSAVADLAGVCAAATMACSRPTARGAGRLRPVSGAGAWVRNQAMRQRPRLSVGQR